MEFIACVPKILQEIFGNQYSCIEISLNKPNAYVIWNNHMCILCMQFGQADRNQPTVKSKLKDLR